MRTWLSLNATVFCAVIIAAGLTQIAMANSAPVAPINTKDGLAIKGFDPVTYFDSGQPTKGSGRYSLHINGATYRFSTAENLQRFKTNPSKFGPTVWGLLRVRDVIESYRRHRSGDVGDC
jgi:YHS domain-containing protein